MTKRKLKDEKAKDQFERFKKTVIGLEAAGELNLIAADALLDLVVKKNKRPLI